MIDRREFVRGISAAVAATTLASDPAIGQVFAQTTSKTEAEADRQIARTTDSSPFRIGIIGPGSRGKELVRNFLRVPGVKIVAAADVYQPRFAELNAVCGYEVPSYTDFRKLLDRKDLDAVIVSTPLGLHASHVIPALESGHHVYGEKAMAYHLEDARRIVEATKANKRIFQIGHQYRYSPWIRAAVARVKQGEIGEVTHIMAYWNRNNNWRRPVPDPSLERLINWRLYNEWSLGLFAELGSHHMDIANWILDATPTSAIASGSICYWHDGRETDDNVQAVLSYPGGRRCIFTSMTNNAKMGDQLWVYGDKGSLNLTLLDATFYYEPKHKPHVVPAKGAGKAVVTSASYQPAGEMPYRGPGKPVEVTTAEDPTTAATRAFVYCVRTGTDPISNVHVGYGSDLCVIPSNESRHKGQEVQVPAAI
ncbi:Gfo/Idh/MocA family oxidoreductase [Edaphobacter sp.]|uniref:Gfo/Idh/MocA family protein n=1 Tax=Edaphobacter sp. TaxID=1934404 RepID=UPI002DB65365|nr:Gfo/Idh/MocA family oxidoreductase [Edaphobacter sp.]HEU5342571.1 Gfo/Idh/MocA family oxidoreductase [Edaphobacter sp.]